jgi:hypothetical protein
MMVHVTQAKSAQRNNAVRVFFIFDGIGDSDMYISFGGIFAGRLFRNILFRAGPDQSGLGLRPCARSEECRMNYIQLVMNCRSHVSGIQVNRLSAVAADRVQ